MKLYFIVNPVSKSGNGIRIWECIEPILMREKQQYRVFFTKYPGHACKIAEAITGREKQVTLIALGGDGTVNEVVNGITDLESVLFGYIPTGSGNDFARAIGLAMTPEEALERIIHKVHFTRINVGTVEGNGQKRRFVVSCGLGFDAQICAATSKSWLKKQLNRVGMGKLSYGLIALGLLFGFRKMPMSISIPGKPTEQYEKAYLAAVMNGAYEGGGVKLCPKARIDDDRLDLCLVENMSKLKLLAFLPTAYFGFHRRFTGISIKTGKDITIHTPRPQPVHCDGESFGQCEEIHVALEKDRLCVIG